MSAFGKKGVLLALVVATLGFQLGGVFFSVRSTSGPDFEPILRALDGDSDARSARELAFLERVELASSARALELARGLAKDAAPETWWSSLARRQDADAVARARALVEGRASLEREELSARAANYETALARAVNAAIRSRVLALALVIVLTLSALTAALWWFYRGSVAAPLTRLVQTMDQVAEGGDHRIKAEGASSFAPVFRGFNRMADALTATRGDLEQQVDRKTQALASALSEQKELNRRLSQVLAELEQTQQKLARQEKMAALGTLAGGVAHEFNNVLGGIRGCAADLHEDISDPEQRETVEVVLRAAERGRRIVEGLMRFSRGSARTPRRVALKGVVVETVGLLRHQAARAEVSIVINEEGTGDVFADPVELSQVIDNLVRNALEASPKGSEVTLVTQRAASSVVVEVRDRGAGVPEALKSRIFEPFFTSKEREGGTGLGLAISHGIIQGLGGEITVHDGAGGVGATFRVTLKAAEGGSDGQED